jgi:hypothetical protein
MRCMFIVLCLSVCEFRLDLGGDLQSRSDQTLKDRHQTQKLRYSKLIFLTLYLHMNNGDYDWDVGKK